MESGKKRCGIGSNQSPMDRKAKMRYQVVLKRAGILVSGVVVAAAAVLDVATDSIGLVRTMTNLFVQPSALVRVRPVVKPTGQMCIEFAFDKLPLGFNVGTIEFEIIGRHGPVSMMGDMAAPVPTITANEELSPAVFSAETEKIDFDARFQADQENDAALVDYCPTLTMPGLKGKLTLVPSFFSIAGEPIQGIRIVTGQERTSIEEGVEISLSRPKNVTVVIDKARLQLGDN